MLTQQEIQQQLSWAYVSAIAARAGVGLSKPQSDFGTDGTFRRIEKHNGQYLDMGLPLDFQLKASTNWSHKDKELIHDLDADAYRRLVTRKINGGSPIVLLLFTMPEEEQKWIEQSEDELLVRHCCYWWEVPSDWSDNTSTQRIFIPRDQQLTPSSLTTLLQLTQAGTLK